MGISASKRVQKSLKNSQEFKSACASVYAECISLSQHAFPGIKPYQLFSATEQLHAILSLSLQLISKWLPNPPDRAQVDRALKTVVAGREEEIALNEDEFNDFAAEVFADAVASSARMEVLKKVPLGAAGIASVGLVVKPGKEVLAVAIGAYALGVATSTYLSLDC